MLDGRVIRTEHCNANRESGVYTLSQWLSDRSPQGSVLLTRHTGGPVSDEEARQVLEHFGAIEETCPVSVSDQNVANLPEGRWVKFAYFQDCCDATLVCLLLIATPSCSPRPHFFSGLQEP